MQQFNETLLVFLNKLLEYDGMKVFVNIFADGPIFFLPLFLVGWWLYYSYSKTTPPSTAPLSKGRLGGVREKNNYKKDLLFIFYATVFAIVFNLVFQKFFHFARPDEICQMTGQLILDKIPEASFPSDHAGVSFAFLTGLFLAGYKKTGIIFSFFVILMNLSRIIACVHWPLDIIVGAFVGIIWAFVTFKIFKKWKIFDKFNAFILKMMEKIGM